MTISELRARHPMPWRYTTINGIVLMHDAAGQEVPLFTMLDLVCQVTVAFSRSEAVPG